MFSQIKIVLSVVYYSSGRAGRAEKEGPIAISTPYLNRVIECAFIKLYKACILNRFFGEAIGETFIVITRTGFFMRGAVPALLQLDSAGVLLSRHIATR